MAVPTIATYSVAAKEAAHLSFRDLIDAGASNGTLKIRDASDVLLVTVPLADPCGTVSAVTGILTITAQVATTIATGTAAYGELCDSTGTVHLSIPAVAGTSSVSGKLVLNSLNVLINSEITIVSATIG
jgi:hypothetical protein